MKNIVAALCAVTLMSGCSLLNGSNKTQSEAIKYVNLGIAVTQCIQDCAKDTGAEVCSKGCVDKWVGPEMSAKDAASTAKYTQLAADVAACARASTQYADAVPKDQHLSVLLQGLLNCASEYVGQIVSTVQTAKAK